MARSLLDDTRFKIQFSGHETFPLRYGWLKKSYDAVCAAIASGSTEPKSVFTSEAAIADFGVGKNMVASMRHWSIAANILHIGEDGTDGGRLEPTEMGELIFSQDGDPFLEDTASLWLIHWHFASTPNRTTTWYWAFNELNEPTFTRDLIVKRLQGRCADLRESNRLKDSRITEVTLKRDVECFVRTYAARSESGRAGQEDSLECPLSELALVQSVDNAATFQFRRGPKMTLPDEVFLYGLLQFWETFAPTRRDFSVESLSHDPGSPGRVFLLDEESVVERLISLGDLTEGAIWWDESAGMRQVRSSRRVDQIDGMKFLRRLYAPATSARAA